MDDTTQDVGETDEFARLLAQLNAPTTDPIARAVEADPTSTSRPDTAPAFGSASPIPRILPAPHTVDAAFPAPPGVTPQAPELRGADELAAPPRPFPTLHVDSTTAVSPPVLDAATVAQSTPVAPLPVSPAPAPFDFAALLAPSPGGADPARPPIATRPDGSNEPDIGKSTVGEKITFILSILLPPIGLLAAVVAAIISAGRRGWVIGLLKAAIAIGVVLSVLLGIGGYYGYTVLQQQLAHDRTAAASSAFCSTLRADPTMRQLPTFGWPAVAASIPDSLVAMQAYEDRWTKLAKVSPPGIEPGVTKVAAAAKQIVDSVTVSRTVSDGSNISAMSAAASASGIPAWYAEYCS